MKDLSFHEGQTVLIILKNKDIKDEYFSKIRNVERKYLVINNPFEEKNIPIKKNDLLSFFILEDNDIYNFTSNVEEIKFGRNPELIIEKPKDLVHNQRRISIRFPLAIIVKYEIETIKSFFKHGPVEGTAIAKNISISGILMETNDKFSDKYNNINVKLNFTLPAYPPIKVNGKITRISPKDKGVEFAVNFFNLDPHDKENIVKYIFNTQKKYIMEKTLLEKL
ncbi:MAG: PilZ domain-containing protein [Candidatus Firestonebacteria bacterium]|nr:PilZ domain-containing protein [Candidatus Firestonebacteria bacterium]